MATVLLILSVVIPLSLILWLFRREILQYEEAPAGEFVEYGGERGRVYHTSDETIIILNRNIYGKSIK